MRKENVLLVTIVVLFSVSSFAQENSFERLTLNLTPLKAEVLQMEPIPLKLTLANNTANSISGVVVSFNFSSQAIKLEVRQPNGKVAEASGLAGILGQTYPQFFPRQIGPGEKLETTAAFINGHYRYFGKIGSYKVRASVRNGDGKIVRSDWVNLTVAAPVALEKDAYDYMVTNMKKRPNDYSPFGRWTTDEMEEFVLKYPGTVYSDYVRYTLGQIYFSQEKTRAESHFRQINDKDFVYAGEISKKLEKLEEQKNQD